VKYFDEGLVEAKTVDSTTQECKVHQDDKVTSENENKHVRNVEELERKLEAVQDNLKAAHKNSDRLENLLKEEKSNVIMSENQAAELTAELLRIKSEKKTLSTKYQTLQTEVSDLQGEKGELKKLCSEKQKEFEVLESEIADRQDRQGYN
jgi:chromosome segregation ATPase